MFVFLPYKVKSKKICAFLDEKNKNIETITKSDFKKYSEKKELKKLVKKFDFFVSQASLMASVATAFGRVLGPAGKMPSPHLGILTSVGDREIESLVEKINKSVRIRTKEASIKLSVGRQSMRDEEIIGNILAIYGAVWKALPREKENIKNIEVKFTMTKPVKIIEDEKGN
jgi:large subunit ribosomal protein L1